MSGSIRGHRGARCRVLGAALALAMLVGTVPVAAAEVSGTIRFSGRQSKNADPRNVVVQFTPEKATRATDRRTARPFTVTTVRKDFSPKVVAVPAGSTVRFPNNDKILHNVFSVTQPNAFDLGVYGRGEGKSATFEHPGVVKVYCNVHPQMVAYVVVGDTPFITYPDADGTFRLEDLPDGTGTLSVWHERAGVWNRALRLSGIETLDIELELTRSRLPHRNKFGRRYASRRGRRY